MRTTLTTLAILTSIGATSQIVLENGFMYNGFYKNFTTHAGYRYSFAEAKFFMVHGIDVKGVEWVAYATPNDRWYDVGISFQTALNTNDKLYVGNVSFIGNYFLKEWIAAGFHMSLQAVEVRVRLLAP